MKLIKLNSRILTSLVVGSLLVCTSLAADVRADYLIGLLKSGSSYRVKIQAAQSLGRIQCREAIPALQDALNDESPHVVIAAAAALSDIGDPSALPALKQAAAKKNHSTPVKTQLMASIRVLQSTSPDTSGASDAGVTGDFAFLVKVDAMGNSSTSQTPRITEVLQQVVADSLRSRPGIEIQPANLSSTEVKKKLKSGKTKGFILSVALIKLQREQDYMVAKIALNVLTNPDYNLIMMPSGEARVPIDFSAVQRARSTGSNEAAISKLEKEAIASSEKIVLEKLVQNLIGKILEAAPDVL